MASEELQDVPLSALFQRALARHDALDGAGSPAAGADDQEAAAWLHECERRVEALALFSANEELADVSTPSLRFLLAPFLLAELQARTSKRDPAARSDALQQARRGYSSFLERCDGYGLVPHEARADAPADPQARRQRKIERFRREKAARARLAAAQRAQLAGLRASLASLELEGDGAEAGGGGSAGDSEAEREAWLTRVELAVLRAAEQLPLLEQELQLLAHAAALPSGAAPPPQPPPPGLLAQLRAAASGLAGEQGRRAQLAAGVFRPSHALPTRSLEQQARVELAQAAQAEAGQAAAAQQRRRLEAGEGHQLAKQRAWDDWKDDNPRGAGNSKLRPTA